MTWKRLSHLGFVLLVTAFGISSAHAQFPLLSTSPPSQSTVHENASGADNHEQVPVLQHRNRRYQLHSADVLELSFPFTPEFNQTVTVQPDGYITLRGADSIRVEGQTLPEATNSLRTAYGKILHDPVVNVELKDFEKPYFIVGGEVGRPGKFDLRGDTTAAEAVAIAGGLKESSKHSQVLLFHRVPDGWLQVKRLNMKKMLKDANLNEDAYLQPGDFLFVPKNTLSKIERFIPTSSLGLYANPGVL
ncbi:MAG: polysaccharide biosynthesis/export family protein [Candidatus Acidiferrum sp.]